MASLVTTNFQPKLQSTPAKVGILAEGQSNLGFMTSGGTTNGITTGYEWQGTSSDLLQLIGYTGTVVRVADQPGYLPTGQYTIVGGTSTYETDAQFISSANLLTPTASGSTFTAPATWPAGTRGTACIAANQGQFGTMPSSGLVIFNRCQDEDDSTGSATKMSFYGAALPRLFSLVFRGAQPLPIAQQPIFFGSSSFVENENANAWNTIRQTQLALVNSGQNFHYWVGNGFDSGQRFNPPDNSHMDDASDWNFCARGMFQQSRKLWEQGWASTNLDWMIGLGARIGGWTVPATKTAYVNIVPDRNDDIIPQQVFNPKIWYIIDGTTQINVLSCTYLNSTTLQLSLDGTPSAAAILDFCSFPGFFGAGSIPTCNFHTKIALMPTWAQPIMNTWLRNGATGVPIQKLDEPLQRDKTANINADNVQLGTVSSGGTVVVQPPPGNNTPATLVISTIANITLGGSTAISGTYGGTAPTTLNYCVDFPTGGAQSLYQAASATIGSGAWSFTVPAAELPAGTHTVTVQEANATTVVQTSNSFLVVQPVVTAINAATFISRCRVGVNLDGQCIVGAAGQAAIRSVKAACTGGFIRNFWRHALTNNIGGYAASAGTLLTASDISNTLDGVAYAISIGVPVDLGLYGDSLYPADYANNSAFAISQVTALCQAIAARNFDMTMLCVHNINEFGNVAANSDINPVNLALDTIIRKYLPNVPILRKGADWGAPVGDGPTGSLDNPLDSNYILGCHDYNTWTSSAADTTCAAMQAAAKSGGYQGWMFEEAGFAASSYSAVSYQGTVWAGSWQALIPAIIKYGGVACAWCITQGTDWRLNNSSTDLTLSTTSTSALAYFSGSGYSWPPLNTVPTTPTTPTAGAIAVTVNVPSSLLTGSDTFTGSITNALTTTTLALLWLTSGTPTATTAGWTTANISSNGTWSVSGVAVNNGGTQGTLYSLVNGATIAASLVITPTNPPVVNTPPVCTVQPPTTLQSGPFTFVVNASGTFSKLELDWGSSAQGSPPVTTDPGWTAFNAVTLNATVDVTGPNVLGGLWYRFTTSAGLQPPALAFVQTPTPAPSIGVITIPDNYAGQPIYVTGTYTGPDPTSIVYSVDVGVTTNAITISDPGTVAEASLGAGVVVDLTFTAQGLSTIYIGLYTNGNLDGAMRTLSLNSIGVGTALFTMLTSGDLVKAYNTSNPATATITGVSNPVTIIEPTTPTVTMIVAPANPFVTGNITFAGTLSATATSVDMIWQAGGTPTSTSAWVAATIVNLVATATVTVSGASVPGTLWYRINKGNAQDGFDATPQAPATGTPPPVSGGGSVPGVPAAGDVTSTRFHLTAQPWVQTSVSQSTILTMIEGLVQYFVGVQNSDGSINIVNPNVNGGAALESPQSTACFFYGACVLAAAGNTTYLSQTLKAGDWSFNAYNSGNTANGTDGPDFEEAPMFNGAAILNAAGHVSSSEYSTWKSEITSLKNTPSNDTHNWGSYACYGAWAGYKQGFISESTAQSFIEGNWTSYQNGNFDPSNGLFMDGSSPDSMSVENVGRGRLLAMAFDGYSGPSAATILSKTLQGTATALMLQDPSGMAPTGGRTSDHVWVDSGIHSIYAASAQYYATSNPNLAGQYQQAANLAFNQEQRWKNSNGSFEVTKNFYGDSARVGYQTASSFASYNANVLLGAAEAYQCFSKTVTPMPCPVEIGGYGFTTGSDWSTYFANAGGVAVEIETRATATNTFSNWWSAVGIVRIGTVNWDTRLGPADSRYNGSVGVSFAPCWLSGSTWTRLASLPSSYQGTCTTLMASPVLTMVKCVWAPTSGNSGPTFTQILTITPDGVFSSTTQIGASQWGMTFPLMHDDGQTTFTQATTGGIASVANGASTQNYIALDPAVTFTAESEVQSTFGNITPIRAVGTASTQNTFVYPTTTGDPSATSVKSSFVVTSNGFTSNLGFVVGALYSGRTSAGGFGSAISLSNGSTADATFSTNCYFVCQVANGVITNAETDRACTATINGHPYTFSAYTPITVAGR